ncbi:O-antigen polymerase [Tenacibaculum sp. UWU-22]|uniref:O-antigen polymerase n=1 Tax=Tenacibaculum sp. UWU-22 TaxID=3234187 RepID=UPI0034DAD195
MLVLSKNNNYVLIFLSFVFVMFGFLFQVNEKVLFFSVLIYAVFFTISFKFEFLYPPVLLIPTVFIYNSSVIILDFLNIREASHIREILFSIFLAITVIGFYSAFFLKNRGRVNVVELKSMKITTGVLGGLLNVLIIILSLYVLRFIVSGVASKAELAISGSFSGFGIISKFFVFIFSLYILNYYYDYRSFPRMKLIMSLTITVLISLIIGERDVLLTIVLILMLIFYFIKKPSKIRVIVYLGVAIFLIPITSQLKAIFTRNTKPNSENVFIRIFSGEFLSSGRNYETILKYSNAWDYFYGESLLNDIKRSIVPPFIYEFKNSVHWFNSNFFTNGFNLGYGIGFSYLAEGYINFGYFGIILWYFFLMIVVTYLYNSSYKSILGLAIYLLMLPNLIYLQRGDFSYLVSPLFKQVLFFYILLTLINSLYRKK